MSRRCDLLAVGVMSGNKVSHSNRKTRRKFLPNLKSISLKSDTLGVNLNLRIAASTLRTINKFGNIDAFLINYHYAKLTCLGKKLRIKIRRKLIDSGKISEVKIVREKKVIKKAAGKKVSKKKAS